MNNFAMQDLPPKNPLLIKNPIFIVGHSRSGSTLLASLLGNHPGIDAVPESHFWIGVTRLGFLYKWRVSFWSKLKIIEKMYEVNPRLNDLPISKQEWLKCFADSQSVTMCAAFNALLAVLQLQLKAGRILEKTPGHLEFVPEIFKCTPKAKVICIIRDGRDAVDSLMTVPWTHSNAKRHASYWSWCVRYASECKRKYPEQFCVVRYEDLLLEPVNEMQRICLFLGEKFCSSMLASDNSRSVVVPEWEKEWKSKSKSNIDSSYAFKWKNKNCHDVVKMQNFMEYELKMLDYPLIGSNHKHLFAIFCCWAWQNFYDLRLFIVMLLRKFGISRLRTFRSRQINQ